jgi:hypothetical protein
MLWNSLAMADKRQGHFGYPHASVEWFVILLRSN